MIWRIFNLGKGDKTGMHIYLDPETLRKNHKLEFSAHTWAVKPLVKQAWPTAEVTEVTTRRSDNTATNDSRKNSGSINFGGFGVSASNSVPRSSDQTFRSSTPEPRKRRSSNQGFRSSTPEPRKDTASLWIIPNSTPSVNDASTQSPPRSNRSGPPESSSTLGMFPASDGASPKNEPPESSSLSPVGSRATSSNSRISTASPGRGLFGANATVANDPVSKTRTTSFDFSIAPTMTNSSGFGSPAKAISTSVDHGTAPSVTTISLFGSSSNASSTGLNFGTVDRAVSKVTFPSVPAFSGFGFPPKASSTASDPGTIVNNDASKDTSSSASGSGRFGFSTSTTSETPSGKSLFGSTEGYHSSKSSETPSARVFPGSEPGSIFSLPDREHLNPIWSTQSLGIFASSPSATSGASGANPLRADAKTQTTSVAEVHHSSSTQTRPIFGIPATSTDSGPSQTTTGRPAFGAGTSFGKPATSTESGPSKTTTGRPAPAFGAGTTFGEPAASIESGPSKTTTSRPVFGAGIFSGKASASTSHEPDSSRILTADLRREREGKEQDSSNSAATAEKSEKAETQPAATRDGTNDKTQTGGEQRQA